MTPTTLLYEGKVEKVEIPTLEGPIGVLPHHAPLSSIVSKGKLRFIPKEKEGQDRILDAAAFLFENDYTVLEVAEGILYVDGEELLMFVRYGNEEEKAEKITSSFDQAHLEIAKLTQSLKIRKIKNVGFKKK